MPYDLLDLDMAPVQAALRSEGLLEDLVNDIAKRVWKACSLWLEGDLDCDWAMVEWFFETPKARGILDLVTCREGRIKVIDWKTTSNVKEPSFQNRIKYSAQSKLYLTEGVRALEEWFYEGAHHYPNPKSVPPVNPDGFIKAYLEYRCLDIGDPEKQGNLVVPVLRTPELERGAAQLLEYVERVYGQMSQESGPWLQNMPGACLRYWERDPQCSYWHDCTGEAGQHPPLLTEADLLRASEVVPKSKSAIEAFWHCPERFRRDKVLQGNSDDGNVKTRMGTCLHAAIAEIYTQVFFKAGKLLELPSAAVHPIDTEELV